MHTYILKPKSIIYLSIYLIYFDISILCIFIKGINDISILVLFTNPSARAGYDTRSMFKRSLTGLNSEFSFS